ncbi:hypothetical protein H8K90_03935 [Winogradskyella echinorum]|uniref:NlpC/P60 family protein n=1 Tax=Winogradskyella echinorum TaxID=538189 RepID=A0ABR6XYG7_9FLAO|nr:hypothetical protein [Winogradskyella echinorum]MBC3845522.1 hypothetical protein [Winogradskyella echinorum]MBC5749870.1 hypothetical protein [Winogradskyella echinorum]
MSKISFLIILLFVFGCHSEKEKEIVSIKVEAEKTVEEPEKFKMDSTKLDINFKPKGNYQSLKSEIKTDKVYFKNLYQTNKVKAIDSVSKYLYSKLLNDIVPHWYETPWDFNGHTNRPNNGEIACGYFVSTTLKHLGFNLNRYKMAQAAGLDEAKLLQSKAELKIYSSVSFKELKAKVNKVYLDGIYFVGLDNHVGYVLIKDKELYFLHSSYCDNKVVIELAEDSPCFRSNLYVFAEVTTNRGLIKSWVFSEQL